MIVRLISGNVHIIPSGDGRVNMCAECKKEEEMKVKRWGKHWRPRKAKIVVERYRKIYL